MPTRRDILKTGAALMGGALVARRVHGAVPKPLDNLPGHASPGLPPHVTPVVMPNGTKLPYVMDGGVKVFHLVAQKVKREFAPGMVVDTWGYNGECHGPMIEVVEGDRVRLLVTNELSEPTSVHWHGVRLPNGMDGVAGLNQPHILPGETYAYEYTLRQNGTQMYHPHSDEMVQMAMGMMGFFIIHPNRPRPRKIDRDFAIFLQEWFIDPGTSTPNPMIMLDFNLFTFNARAWPGTAPLVAKTRDRVRIRIANLSMDSHPIHLHGPHFRIVATDGGQIPTAGQWPETTVNVHPGSTRDIEVVADDAGDWAFHCHKNHHVMNPMGHDVPNLIGVSQKGIDQKIRKHLPRYMPMMEHGMGQMHEMGRPKNTLPMMTGQAQFGAVEMGGMFTVLKVRDELPKGYDADPGWYTHPPGTVAWKVT
jgi:FtsP/CotA-like multicopper oxidase with cupredoxin domain